MTPEKAIETLEEHARFMEIIAEFGLELGSEVSEACLLAVHVLRDQTPRPIEFPPEDGVIVLLCDVSDWYIGWRAGDEWSVSFTPTHWLPLPKSPEVQR